MRDIFTNKDVLIAPIRQPNSEYQLILRCYGGPPTGFTPTWFHFEIGQAALQIALTHNALHNLLCKHFRPRRYKRAAWPLHFPSHGTLPPVKPSIRLGEYYRVNRRMPVRFSSVWRFCGAGFDIDRYHASIGRL